MKTKNLAVGILATLLTTALWYTFLFKPIRAQQSKVKAATATERSKLQPLQAQLAQAQTDAAHAAAFKAELQSLLLAMPDSPALAAFIRDANNIAAASNVSWQSVTHAPPVAGAGGVMSITIGISIKGTYPQVLDYLGRLAGLQRLVVVDGVQFNPAASSGTGAGAGSAGAGGSSGGSTGPFSGAPQLTVTISARMFETPGTALSAVGTGTVTGVIPAAGTTKAASSTLNNS
jgi:Tfp pilus assembly protein PilO